jgi:CBS domain-containing protein
MFIEGMLPTTRDRLAVIRHDAPLKDAARLLARAEINLVVVCNPDATFAGVITKTDVVRHLSHCDGAGSTVAASTVMTSEVTCCRPDDLLDNVWSIMREHHLKHVPVIDVDSRPIGVLYARDALEVLLGKVQHKELLLRDYVMGIGYR